MERSNCGSKKDTVDEAVQLFPSTGSLAKNVNIADLGSALSGSLDGNVYAYVVASIWGEGAKFVQRGSAPNFQGGIITLCTCKRRMRTFRRPEGWRGVWIAGFCGAKARAVTSRQALFYLMQVKDAYESHRDLWKALPNSVRTAKTARVHRLGDVYEPRSGDDPFDPGTYYPPVEKHSHASERWPDEWREDIKYLGKKTRRHAALLVGDPDRSYLWNSPMFIYSAVLHRGQKKFENLGAFLAELKPCR